MTKFLKLLLLLFFTTASFAQDGTLDYSFNPVTGAIGGNVAAMSVQPDGKIVVGGDFTQLNNLTCNKLGRLNADGTLDGTLNIGTGFNNIVNSISVQPDGKIIVAGSFTTFNGSTCNRIVRLNPNGSVDPTFNIGNGANNNIFASVVLADGKILVAGEFSILNGASKNKIARLNGDGTIDATFASTGANDIINAMAVQPDGKIVVGGNFATFGTLPRSRVARLNSDGSMDTTFSPTTGAGGSVRTICLQNDGKIVIGGYFTSYNGTPANYIARLNADSTLDTTFASSTGFSAVVNSVISQADGKLIVAGDFTSYNGSSFQRIAGINSDGTADTAFNSGSGATAAINTLLLQSNGKVLAGGAFLNYNGFVRNRIVSINTNGTVDTGFYPFQASAVSSSGRVRAITVQSDGKILIGGGSFSTYNGLSSPNVARLNADGTLDPSFNVGTGASGGSVTQIAVLPNNKILIVGNFTAFNGVTANRIARLNADGSLDTTFNTGSGANAGIQALAVQPDGKIIIGGSFYAFNGVPKDILARLNQNGSIDTSFITGGNGGGIVETILVLPDGKIFIGGSFPTYEGTWTGGVARLNSNGTLDNTFNVGGAGAEFTVYTSSLQGDGKIIVAGAFDQFNNQPHRNLTRLNSNGTLDATFNCTTLSVGSVYECVIQNDGKIIVGGVLGPFNGFTGSGIMRLNTDGTLDNTLIQGTGFDSYLQAVALQNDGKILTGGNFMTYNGIAKKYIVRLNGTGTLGGHEFENELNLSVYPNPAKDYLFFNIPNDLNILSCEVFDITGKVIDSSPLTVNSFDIRHYTQGLYILHVKTDQGVFTAKFIKE